MAKAKTETPTNNTELPDELPDMLYFGCGNDGCVGHFFWQTDDHQFGYREAKHALPWKQIDGALCPRLEDEPEGVASLHRRKGWTALAFWDRTVDRRPGSNSVFFAKGAQTFARMVELACFYFPKTWKRFSFAVKEPNNER